MFQYLKGTIEEIFKDYFIIEVNNIGYKVGASLSTLSTLQKDKGLQKIYTYVHIKEDGWNIYGFKDREELDMFELLITVSGVGPKVAIGILSACSPSRLAMLISSADAKSLSKLPGIGAKTSQRIILELKDKVDISELTFEDTIDTPVVAPTENKVVDEAIEALLSLGYSVNESRESAKASFKDGDTVEGVIKKALSAMAKGNLLKS